MQHMRSAPTEHPPRPVISRQSLDLGFLVLDVFLGDRIVFFFRQLLGLRARILAGHVVVPGPGARHELDLQTDRFGHGTILETSFRYCWRRTVAAEPQMSRTARLYSNSRKNA